MRDRGGTARYRGRRGWRGQEAHEGAEPLDVAQRVIGSGLRGIGHTVRSSAELAACRFVALDGEQLAGDAHLDVVGLARKQQSGHVLLLPAEAGDSPIVGLWLKKPEIPSERLVEAL